MDLLSPSKYFPRNIELQLKFFYLMDSILITNHIYLFCD